MTAIRKPGFVLPVAVTLTVLLGLYVGAYYAMLKPVDPRVKLISHGTIAPDY